MHLFGTPGSLMFILGPYSYVYVSKLLCVYIMIFPNTINTTAIVLFIADKYDFRNATFSCRISGKMIARNDKDRNRYIVEKETANTTL